MAGYSDKIFDIVPPKALPLFSMAPQVMLEDLQLSLSLENYYLCSSFDPEKESLGIIFGNKIFVPSLCSL